MENQKDPKRTYIACICELCYCYELHISYKDGNVADICEKCFPNDKIPIKDVEDNLEDYNIIYI